MSIEKRSLVIEECLAMTPHGLSDCGLNDQQPILNTQCSMNPDSESRFRIGIPEVV
jgi:hypothetical protein